MKIEMGESLGASWLKHVKKCLITQTNWRASQAWKRQNVEEVKTLICDAKKYFTDVGYPIISDYDFKTANFSEKIVNACECDIVGVSFDGDIPTFHTFESAFHKGGLCYGNAKVNAETVGAKLFLSALSLITWFGARRGELVFATPSAGRTTESKLLEIVVHLENFFAVHQGFAFSFDILMNADYSKYVLSPVLALEDSDVSDDELFLRSIVLERLASASAKDLRKREREGENVHVKTMKVPKGSLERVKRVLKIDDLELNKILANERKLYDALLILKASPDDPCGWLQYALRWSYCERNGIRRITLLDLMRKYGKPAEDNNNIVRADLGLIFGANIVADDPEWEAQKEKLKHLEMDAMMRLPVTELKLRPRSLDCLIRANIETIRQLVSKKEATLRAQRNFGKYSLKQIKSRIEDLGLHFVDE